MTTTCRPRSGPPTNRITTVAVVTSWILASATGLFGCIDADPEEPVREARETTTSLVVEGVQTPAASESEGRAYAAEELERFARAAALTDAQRSALLDHLDRFERHRAGMARSSARAFIDRLHAHTRALITRELSNAQVELFDGTALPGSRALQPTAHPDESVTQVRAGRDP